MGAARDGLIGANLLLARLIACAKWLDAPPYSLIFEYPYTIAAETIGATIIYAVALLSSSISEGITIS